MSLAEHDTSSTLRPEILERDAHLLLATYENLLMQFWGTESPLASVEKVLGHVKRFTATKRKPWIMTVWVDGKGSPPDAAARKKIEEVERLLGVEDVYLAYIYNGEGLKAAIMRNIMVALMLMRRSSGKSVVVRNLEEALAWLDSRVPATSATNAAERRAALTAAHDAFVG